MSPSGSADVSGDSGASIVGTRKLSCPETLCATFAFCLLLRHDADGAPSPQVSCPRSKRHSTKNTRLVKNAMEANRMPTM